MLPAIEPPVAMFTSNWLLARFAPFPFPCDFAFFALLFRPAVVRRSAATAFALAFAIFAREKMDVNGGREKLASCRRRRLHRDWFWSDSIADGLCFAVVVSELMKGLMEYRFAVDWPSPSWLAFEGHLGSGCPFSPFETST